MQIQFLGAAQTVTGSCYMIEVNGVRFGIDCGMHQGNKEIEKRNADRALYLKPKVDFFLLTHAHIDHSGLLPAMTKDGFKGNIYCTEPTAALLDIMLQDSAHIQEMEALWENRKMIRKGSGKRVEPLYTQDDAKKVTPLLTPVQYNAPFEPAPGIRVTYRDAGHILGSAFLELEITENEQVTRLVFSGDLGRPDAYLMNNPSQPKLEADYLFMESTYGDRDHKDTGSSLNELSEALEYCRQSGGKVIIPAFAVERTQELLYILYLLHKQGRLPDVPIFVDSPLAIRATEVFMRFPNYMDDEIIAMLDNGEKIDLPQLRFTLSTEESQAINAYEGPAIIIAASGMCNAGRIKHHLRHNLWNPNNCVVFVGYQAVGTPGRKIVDGADSISLFGEDIGIKAKIFTIGGFSSHAGQSQILTWLEGFARPSMNVFLIHGEPKAQRILSQKIQERFKLHVDIPTYLEEVTLAPGLRPMVQLDTERAAPKVNWGVLMDDSRSKLDSINSAIPKLAALPWEEQVELRDAMLDINARLLSFLSKV